MVDLAVACVLWVGKFKGRRYTGRWVERLRAMVSRNLSIPHRFVCLSNVYIPGIEVIRLEQGWPGWWSKLELFGHDLGKRVLYLDLDVLVTGSLNDLVNHPAPMVVMPPHSVLLGLPPMRGRPDVIEKYQTSCMVWSPPEGRKFYNRFHPDVSLRLLGDQDWMAELDPDLPTFDRRYFRKLRQCTQGPGPDVRVVLSMPWKNDEASNKFPWVKRLWQGDGDLLGSEGSLAHAGD